jgi:hypothetical protein
MRGRQEGDSEISRKGAKLAKQEDPSSDDRRLEVGSKSVAKSAKFAKEES